MKKQFLLLLVVFFVTTQTVFGQDSFWDRVTVRKSFETKTTDDAKPAIFSFTLPKDSTSSFLFNGGVGIDLFKLRKNSSQSITAFGVFNRNTLVDKEQKNYKVGLSAGHFFDLSQIPSIALFGATSLEYLHDYIDTAHSLIVTNYWHPNIKTGKGLSLGGYSHRETVFNYFLLPQVGFEYQNVISAKSSEKKGYDARAFFNAEFHLMFKKKATFSNKEIEQNITETLTTDTAWKHQPLDSAQQQVDRIVKSLKQLRKKGVLTTIEQAELDAWKNADVLHKADWPKLFELVVSYTGRAAFLHYNTGFDKYTPLFTAGLNFYPANTSNFSIGFSFNNGANPLDATPRQTFWLFSLTYKK